MAVYLWRPSLLIAMLAAAIAIPLTEFFPSSWAGVPALTSPFVVAAWIVLAIGQLEVVFTRERVAA
jgi:urea transporter